MKPLFRWTIGSNCSKEGLECLSHSIHLMKKIYGDEFDYFICHNGNNVKSLYFNDVNFLDQRDYKNSLSVKPNCTAWKLYPPRIRLNSHEIFLDNDLIIYNRLPIIDNFLKREDYFFCTQAFKRNYGNYDGIIFKNKNLNTGLFGIPPLFDFAKNIEMRLIGEWDSHFDEQGLVASIFLEENIHIIPNSDVFICAENIKFGNFGLHFVGLNKGNNFFWNKYISSRILLC